MLKIIRKSESGEDRAINVNCCDNCRFWHTKQQLSFCHARQQEKLPRCEHRRPSSRSARAGRTQIYPPGSRVPLPFHSPSQNTKSSLVGTAVTSFVGRSLCLSDRSHLPGTPPSVLLPWWKVGAGEVSNYFICLITQLNTRRNGAFHFRFYKASRKACIFTLNMGMNASRAFLIPERASELGGDTKPQTMHHSKRGQGQSLVPKGWGRRMDRQTAAAAHNQALPVFSGVSLCSTDFRSFGNQSILLLKVRV